jgi:hypothetical protein
MAMPPTGLQQLVGATHAPAAAGRQHQRRHLAPDGRALRFRLRRRFVFFRFGRAADQAADAHGHDLGAPHGQAGQQALQHPVEAIGAPRTGAAGQDDDGNLAQPRQQKHVARLDRHAEMEYLAAGGNDSGRHRVGAILGHGAAGNQQQVAAGRPRFQQRRRDGRAAMRAALHQAEMGTKFVEPAPAAGHRRRVIAYAGSPGCSVTTSAARRAWKGSSAQGGALPGCGPACVDNARGRPPAG